MEEIDLKDLWSYFVSKILLVVIFLVFAILGCCIYSLWIQTPLYQSSTTIVLTRTTQDTDSSAITQNDITMNQKLVSTYREIIKSRRILNKVINNLRLDKTYTQLKSNITVSSEKDTELIRISVVDEDSAQAKAIANEIARVFNNEIVTIYNIQNVNIIDTAEEEVNPYNVHILKQMVVSVGIGLVLACATIFIMFYFDTTIKDPDEVEEKTGLPILGKVPMNGSKGGKKWKN